MAQEGQGNSRSSCHQSVLVPLVGRVRTLLSIRNDPSISFQCPLLLSLPLKPLFHKQYCQICLAKSESQGKMLEICIINSKWWQWSGKSGKSYSRTFELLIIHHKCPASCPFCVFLLSAVCFSRLRLVTHTYLSFRSQLKYLTLLP